MQEKLKIFIYESRSFHWGHINNTAEIILELIESSLYIDS
jgi:hypothetical protein